MAESSFWTPVPQYWWFSWITFLFFFIHIKIREHTRTRILRLLLALINIHHIIVASGKSEDSKAHSQTETLRWKHKMWEVRSVWARSWWRKKNKNKETHFGCIFFSRIVYQSLPVEGLPLSIIQSKERADMALVTTRQCGIPVYM